MFHLTGQVNRDELHRHFYALGVGAIEEIRVQQDKGFGFVRYSTHGEAALAIQMGNGLVVRGKPIKVRSKALNASCLRNPLCNCSNGFNCRVLL